MKYFSIIIPHYNIPHLLIRCLSSIPSRDDLEVIIVDDNSNPQIVDFDNFPGLDEINTKVFFLKEGGGGGYARNIGIEHAVGKWLLFADADDFFHSGFNDFLNSFKDDDSDLIFFNADSVNTDTLKPALINRAKHVSEFINLYSKNPTLGELNLRYLFGEPWGKMVKAEIVKKNHIQFDETKIHNDTTFGYLIGYYAKLVKVLDKVLYCITERSGSVSKVIDEERILIRINVFSRANKFFQDHAINIFWDILYRQMADLLISNRQLYRSGLSIIQRSGLDLREEKKKILKEIPKALGRKYLK